MRDYFYGQMSESFSFYRIPRCFMTDPEYHDLSTDAKLLYGLFLDRMDLSARNGWMDDKNRVYIYFTLEEIQSAIGCSHNKAVRLLAELDDKRMGLIERVRQGQGKPTRIYVKQFIRPERGSLDYPKRNSKTSQNGNSGLPEAGSADLPKKECSYTDKSYTEYSYTNPSIQEMDWMDEKERLKEKLDLPYLTMNYPGEDAESILDLICDILTGKSATITIGGAALPAQRVKERFRSLGPEHIVYVLDSMRDMETPIRNIRAYLLTALYNAPGTMALYYTNAIRQREE